MKTRVLIIAFIIAIAVFIAFSQINKRAFQPAEDFPRGALIYVQIADLPALVKLWNESKFKEKYLASANFHDFTNNHLGRKLASRWQEFNDAAGFPIDLELLSSITGNQAAIALYDVGKLEFIFIAPISDEIFAATQFMNNSSKFTAETLTDGTVIRRAVIEADRGRQKQELLFTQAKGRFILATSEKLLVQTLANVGGKSKNRLSDELLFKSSSEKIQPHAVTVWLNQTILNDDYYFKHYWLMSDVADLKNLRAGIFDFELAAEKIVERRRFLLEEPIQSMPVRHSAANELLAFVPPNAPFYRLQSANPKIIDEVMEKTIFTRSKSTAKSRKRSTNYSSFGDYDHFRRSDYDSLSEEFDRVINDDEDGETAVRREINIDFSKMLQSANPREILAFTNPKMLPAPLFAEFQRAVAFSLASPEFFNRDDFEEAIAQKFADQLLISAPDVKLKWETKTENNRSRRELKMLMLAWEAAYFTRGNLLFLSNNADFLRQIELQHPATVGQGSSFNSLTVINLNQREENYHRIFNRLNEISPADNFFAGNVQSLLDSLTEIKGIEIKEDYSHNIFTEEITLHW